MNTLSKVLFSFLLITGILAAAQSVSAQSLPAGCSTNVGYSSTTGAACNGATAIPAGCSSTAGYSTSTGLACNGSTAAGNGYNGQAVITTQMTGGYSVFLNGCTSLSGYSTTTGYACNTSFPGISLGVFSNPVITPGLPTTGAGGARAVNIVLITLTAIVGTLALRYGLRQKQA